MCVTCGCGKPGETRIEGDPHGDHEHILADGTRVVHRHEHAHGGERSHDHAFFAHDPPHDHGEHTHAHGHSHTHDHEHSEHAAHANVLAPPGGGRPPLRQQQPAEMVQLELAVLDKNQRIAERNRGWLGGRGVLALNMMSSPGAGKTTLLVRTLTDLADEMPMGVIEGDQETTADADRIRATGARAIQINTGAGCHLEADMLARALQALSPSAGSIVFVENVGNLVCPALFDLGERARIVVLSVTEGEDKPLKYPHMFRSAQLMLLTKTDLAPHVRFDADRAEHNARAVNPQIQCLRVSAESGAGLDGWYAWLRSMRAELSLQVAS